MFHCCAYCGILRWIVLYIDGNSSRYLKWSVSFEWKGFKKIQKSFLWHCTISCKCETVSIVSWNFFVVDGVHDFSFNLRLAIDFNSIVEFIITGFFLWTLSTICTSLVTLQEQLVKCFCVWLTFSFFIENISIANSEWLKLKSDWDNKYSIFGNLVVPADFSVLWIWCNSNKSIQSIWWRVLSMSMVFMAKWSATNVLNCRDEYPKTVHYKRIWQHIVHSKCIQSGKFYK